MDNINYKTAITKLEDLGEILRKNTFKLSIIYGSGGYCTMITHNKKQYICFSNDIVESVVIAIDKAVKGKEFISENTTIKY